MMNVMSGIEDKEQGVVVVGMNPKINIFVLMTNKVVAC